MRDGWILALLVSSFAVLLTTHVAIAVRLIMRSPRYKGVLALVVVPLGPYWARTNGWTRSFWLWCGAAACYAAMLALAQR